MAENCVIAKNINVDIWDGSAVFSRIREVNLCLKSQACIGSVDDQNVSNRLIKFREMEARSLVGSIAARNGYCKRSLARVPRSTSDTAVLEPTFDGHNALRWDLSNRNFSQRSLNLRVNIRIY